MPRPLKVFKTHIGFHDLVVAAPSMKAAAQAWGAKPSLFAQGFAALTQDADATKAALAEPGVVLKRPHGQKGPYKADSDAITAPKPSSRQLRAAKKSKSARHQKEVAEKREENRVKRAARANAQAELADIERQEAQLRDRRQKLRKKFHLRSVK